MNKSILVLGSSLSVAGSVGVAYWKFASGSKISFSEKFGKEIKGRILLDVDGSSHDSVWEQLVTEYKENKFDVFGLSKNDLDKNKLKKLCNTESKSTVKDKFSAYVEWCSRNTLRTQFNDKVPSKSWIDSKVESGWSGKVASYPENNDGNLQILDSGTALAKAQITWQKIMDWCSSKVDAPFVNVEDADYKRAEASCTN